jgi:hypothetical protein
MRRMKYRRPHLDNADAEDDREVFGYFADTILSNKLHLVGQ